VVVVGRRQCGLEGGGVGRPVELLCAGGARVVVGVKETKPLAHALPVHVCAAKEGGGVLCSACVRWAGGRQRNWWRVFLVCSVFQVC
jgi:hypothetical protein